MKYVLDLNLAKDYKSKSQIIRVTSEHWVEKNAFCPSCGNDLKIFKNNSPVADFFCKNCNEEYELKSKKNTLGQKINDGAYSSMMKRLKADNNPNLFLLTYKPDDYRINNFLIVPKFLFIPQLIEKRKPLSLNAKRAGWTGCNILIQNIPESGKIFFVKNGELQNKDKVLNEWKKIMFLKAEGKPALKGWLMDVMICIDQINNKEFSLEEVYSFEDVLQRKHPQNKHIKDKIRQQLQYLRDKGYIEFIEKGKYRVV